MNRRLCFMICSLIVSWCITSTLGAESPNVERFIKPKYDHFMILEWPYQTDASKDSTLYKQLGLAGFQIDRGKGQDKKVELSVTHGFPYYVGHVAGKGILYLKGKDIEAVTGKRGLVVRPHSLSDPATIKLLKNRIKENVESTKRGMVLAYAFDDEISLARFTSPCDVDVHPLSIRWFRTWLKEKYGNIENLNKEWDTSYKDFSEVVPQGFEAIRKKNHKPPFSRWNLAPWMDFRSFMDYQFAFVLSELTRYTNALDPHAPAGFVGGQGPGPWGGYDYALLSRAVQWMEAYDINGTNEILRSFWNNERKPRMVTFFTTSNQKLDSWFLWYYMLHGCQAAIAWPEGWFHVKGQEIAPYVKALESTFKEVQGKISEPLVDPNTKFDPDPIGIYYSQPSIQAGWAMDAITHGKTWINRKGSIDDKNQSKGVLRKVWCKTLEDLGFQYDFISYLDVREGRLNLNKKFKVIILPKIICLSRAEAEALRQFVMNGGILIADYLCGVLDEHGKGRRKGILDDLFGIKRDESKGYMNGKGLTEIDAEKYQRPFLQRFTFYKGAYRYKGIVVFEQGTKAGKRTKAEEVKGWLGLRPGPSVVVRKRTGLGLSVYLNLSPLEYWAPERRFGHYGAEWRKIIRGILDEAGLRPRVVVYENGVRFNMIEALFWENGKKQYLCLIKNPTQHRELARIDGLSPIQGITGKEVEIQLEFDRQIRLVNLRSNEHLGVGRVFHDRFRPWEGNVYEFEFVGGAFIQNRSITCRKSRSKQVTFATE
ncbi:MAG: hypothetical protein DRH15_10265 [Deltaproteobacteria bacterium]|nr:MAG: hypothetical protein DRH15_10265 [Deltaproteobacteria bacterium]